MNEKQYEFNYTVIIPAYLSRSNVVSALRSVINQEDYDFGKVQILIMDNAKDTSLREELLPYLQQYPNNIAYYGIEHYYWGAVINYVVKNNLAKGRLVTILEPWDQLSANCFRTVDDEIVDNSDLVISSFHSIIQRKNKNKTISLKRRQVVEFFAKGKVLTKRKQIERARTPWAIGLCKFYKNQLFYLLPRSLEKINYQDSNLFNMALNMSHQVQYIDKSLGYWLDSDERIFRQREWTKKECEDWLISIYNLVSADAKLTALMYITKYKSFKKYLLESNIKIQISGKIKMSWFPFGTRTLGKIFYLIRASKFIVR